LIASNVVNFVVVTG